MTQHQWHRSLGLAWTASLILGLMGLCPSLSAADVYHYVDEEGTIHLSNVPADPRYRKLELEEARPVPRLGSDEVERLIAHHSRRHGLPPALLRAVIKTESDFNPAAVSRAGAIGLMQLMPETAVMLNVRNPFDPEQNVWGGAAHLRALLDRFGGNLLLALAAYNAGTSAVEQYQGLPPYQETRRYVRKVLAHYRRYLAAGVRSGPRTFTPARISAWAPPLVYSADQGR